MMTRRGRRRAATVVFAVALVAAVIPGAFTAAATPPAGNPATYTLDTHFDEGTLINVNHLVPDQLQLASVATPFDFIWIAVSSQGTVVKIAVDEGQEVAEGELVVVLEAMKMEQPLNAHKAGVVSGIVAEIGATVTTGAALLEIKDA